MTVTHEKSSVKSVIFSPDDKRIMTLADGKMRTWDVKTGEKIKSFYYVDGLPAIAGYSADGGSIFGSYLSEIAVWDTKSGKMIRTMKGHAKRIRTLHFSQDGHLLISASMDGTAIIWDVKGSEPLKTFSGHSLPLNDACLSPDGTKLITASDDKKFKLWDVTSGQELLTILVIDYNSWVIIHPSGLFDASPEAMMQLYWVKGLEVIPFNTYKDRYWEPDLWSKVLKGLPLRNVTD